MFYRFLQHSFWSLPASSRTTRSRAVGVVADSEVVEASTAAPSELEAFTGGVYAGRVGGGYRVAGRPGYRGGYYPRRGYGYGAAAVGAAAVGAAAYGAYGSYNNCYDAYGNYICSGQYRY